MIAPKLDSGAALGFFWEVFRARPLVFISLSVWWVAVFLVLGVTQVVMTSEEVALLAAAEASGDDAAVFQAMGPYLLKILLFSSASMVISVFLEVPI
ncbi:MAG: hypothetical protein CMF74_17975 [Maricaulis sp.]|nr:hypothetical protein [Maricaulis sp.]